jgi:hypothetical protein
MIFTDGLLSKSLTDKHTIACFIHQYARNDNWHELDGPRGNLGYGWIHYSFIRNIKPNNILVIGSRYGFIPAICALACKDNGHGHVDFVDAGFDQNNSKHSSTHWGGVGYWNSTEGKSSFFKFGLNKIVSIYVTTSAEFIKTHPKNKWAYIYIDGDHSYLGVRADYDNYWPRLLSGGIMAIHDIYSKNTGLLHYGTPRLWREIKKTNKHTFEFPGLYGLGILQK